MNAHRMASSRRKAIAVFGLALFMLGSNYCLVGALTSGGQPMACMPQVVTADAGDTAPAGHCARHGSKDGEDAPPLTAKSPCCIAFTPVVAPKAGSIDATAALVVPVVATEAVVVTDPLVAGHLLRAPPDSPAPAFLSGAPVSSRAPPLA